MIEELAYLTEPLKLEFDAHIIQKTQADNGQIEVVLDKTYFYPTGGGQMHDTGTLGEANVVDVYKTEAGQVVHRLDRDISGTVLPAHIDEERRRGHMQHHSAQHILSGTLEKLLALETLSVKIRADTPSTLDVPLSEISQVELERVERFANDIIFENRPIKSYFITDDQIHTIPFRRPPQVKGQIRVVEVDNFDYSACGGTHCPYAGMIGLIKIVKTEHKNKKLRLHFVAGHQALRYFQTCHSLITEIGQILSTAPEDVAHIVSGQVEQLQEAQREIKKLRREALSFEAQQLVNQAEKSKADRLVVAIFAERPANELRELAKLLQRKADVIGAVASYDGQRLLLVVTCGDHTNVSAKQLLANQLDQIGGQGGGDDRIAQGGGPASEQQIETFFDPIHDHILAARN